MLVLRNYDLTKFNTFGISVIAKFFVEINNEEDLLELFTSPEFKQNKKIFLGGGSNVLFTENFDGIVVLNKLKGVEVTKENDESVLVRSMGGEIWHDLVMFAVNRGYWGIENLSYIPGTVGAAPMQNIGAYGAELKDTLVNVEAFAIETDKENKKKIFSREECELGYRNSVFKNKLKGKYFISAITLKLSKVEKKNISYNVLKEHLERNKINVRGPKDISDAVTFIRQSKLPDPKIIGNAGSFFKNVFVKKSQLETLLKIYPRMPYFEEEGMTKIPTGWLIEQCGPANGTSWRGYKDSNIGVHPKQALVLVNYGGASGHDILVLAERIITSVNKKFGLELVPEVNIV
jgi:UDP-N-acetylmuramate dehydrogenase